MLNGGMEIIGRSQGQDKEMEMEARNIRSRAGKAGFQGNVVCGQPGQPGPDDEWTLEENDICKQKTPQRLLPIEL